jgi:hypothetical protein
MSAEQKAAQRWWAALGSSEEEPRTSKAEVHATCYRKAYWKFLAQTVRQPRQHSSKAITLAITRQHFSELSSTGGK